MRHSLLHDPPTKVGAHTVAIRSNCRVCLGLIKWSYPRERCLPWLSQRCSSLLLSHAPCWWLVGMVSVLAVDWLSCGTRTTASSTSLWSVLQNNAFQWVVARFRTVCCCCLVLQWNFVRTVAAHLLVAIRPQTPRCAHAKGDSHCLYVTYLQTFCRTAAAAPKE